MYCSILDSRAWQFWVSMINSTLHFNNRWLYQSITFDPEVWPWPLVIKYLSCNDQNVKVSEGWANAAFLQLIITLSEDLRQYWFYSSLQTLLSFQKQNFIAIGSYFSPADKHLDVKKTSFKKLSKFLKEMEKAGYVKVKELSKGVESITEMKKDHPEWVIKEYNFVKMALNSLQYSFSNKFSERSHLYMMNLKTYW